MASLFCVGPWDCGDNILVLGTATTTGLFGSIALELMLPLLGRECAGIGGGGGAESEAANLAIA